MNCEKCYYFHICKLVWLEQRKTAADAMCQRFKQAILARTTTESDVFA